MKTNGSHLEGSGASGLNGAPGKDDAEWSALRYVLGEMTADETEALEQTLAVDPQACERVAAAAGLSAQLYNALAAELEAQAPVASGTPLSTRPAAVAAPARSVRGGLWAVVGVATAVCVLIAGGLVLIPKSGTQLDELAVDRSDAGAGSLVAMWTEGTAETAGETSGSGVADSDRAASDNALSFADTDEDEVDAADDGVIVADGSYDVPAWMLAAVGNDSMGIDGPATDIREN
jgi:hypothetical protein